MSKLPYGLTPQQLRFANCIVEGKNPSQAYREAYTYQSLTSDSLKANAQKVKNNPKVAAYVAECLEEIRREVLLTRDKKRQILGSIALDKKAPQNARIAAIKVDNEMTGDNAPVRVEGEITIGLIYNALQAKRSVLPGADELEEIKQAEPVAPPALPESDPDMPEQTAMERAG